MRYGDVQKKLRPRWPEPGVYGSGYWPTMQQLAFRLWGPGLRLNHGERVPHECVLSAAVSVGRQEAASLSAPRSTPALPAARGLSLSISDLDWGQARRLGP